MGSASDMKIMQETGQILDQFGVTYEMKVLSAHRTPEETAEYVKSAEGRGIQAFIAAAGFAAHLAGAVAAQCVLPVIGVPLDASSLQGLDSLLSTVQMPKGIPVACVTIGKAGAINAGLFAIQILSRSQPELVKKLKDYRGKMREQILASQPS
jgi:phosphoribosylaminoimidazole carboxylase PurE protein